VGNVTSYKLQDLPPGKLYYIALRAYNLDKSILSTFSNEVSATTPPDVIIPPPIMPEIISKTRGYQLAITPPKVEGATNWEWILPGSLNKTLTRTTFTPIYPTYPASGTYAITCKVTVGESIITFTVNHTIPATFTGGN
jgi:hypothetical protein